MYRKFVPDEIAEKYAKIFGISTPNIDNDSETNDTDEETMKEHTWIDMGCLKEDIRYHFTDPKTGRLYTLTLHTWSSIEEYWSVQLSYDNGEPDGWYQDLTSELRATYCCYADELPALKIDAIRLMKERFPHITGWNDGLYFNPNEIQEITHDSCLYPIEFFNLFKTENELGHPRILYVLGDKRLVRRTPYFTPRIAIIGSQTPDVKGLEVAYRLGKFFAGDIVVSGLARGIDTAAHQGCLVGGGRTIAVVGSGLHHVYPKENIELQQRIIETGGMILSEQDPKTKANPRTLIARTRLQMALADKVYVVECEKESGTMHAVNFALKYGKPIFALDCDWSGNRYLIDNDLAKPFKQII